MTLKQLREDLAAITAGDWSETNVLGVTVDPLGVVTFENATQEAAIAERDSALTELDEVTEKLETAQGVIADLGREIKELRSKKP